MTTGHSVKTRLQLLAAAPALAESAAAEKVNASVVARAAGLTTATFRAEFGDVCSYFTAVQSDFFNRRLDHVVKNVGARNAGIERIREALSLYLDFTLTHAALFSWCNAARLRYPALFEELNKRNQNTAMMLSIEFHTLGWSDAQDRGRLAAALAIEVTKLEAEARREKPALRIALWSSIAAFSRAAVSADAPTASTASPLQAVATSSRPH